MHALQLLKDDHAQVNELFDQVDDTDDIAKKRQLFVEIKRQLEVHTHIEETVFYPAFAKREGFHDLIEEAYEEHQEVKDLLAEMDQNGDDEEFEDQLEDLMDDVQHHVDEEEGDLFPKVEEAVDEAELERLGTELERAKQAAPGQAAA